MKMAGKCAGRVITYGLMPDAVLRATDVKSVWPERLSFTLHCDGESHLVETNLCGIHWVHSVLAALAVGYSLGIPLDAAVKAIKTVPPFPGRMSPEKLPSGATMIRDDCKAPIMGFPPVLQFMKEARAERKIMIIGTISDYAGSSSSKYLEIAGKARAVCDYVFFVGRWSPRCLAAKKSAQDDSLQAFPRRKDLIRFLKTFLQPNDLVLIKGSLADKLQVVTRELRTVQEESGSYSRTSEGLDLQDRKTKQAVVKAIAAEAFTGESHNPASSQFSYSEDQSPLQFVVGLGNSEEAYQGTRHNIGQRVLDEVASRLEAAWRREGPAMVGYAQIGDQPVCLVKLITSMNQSGPVLRQFGDRWNVQPSQCILVHDEMDLPVGKVKERMRGSAGGHNGVLSILTTYQSVDFRRVKIGIGRPQNKAMAPTFVLSPFSAEEEPVIDAAVSEASSRVLKLLQTATPQESRISMKARRANSTDRPGLLDRKGRRS